MNITKGDVQELRRRLKKKECTFDRMCGCYVNSGKQIVLKFTDMFSELEEDEYFIADLIGLAVVTDAGEALGTVKDVMETGANDVYIVEMKDGRELLLPAIGDCILDVNLDEGRMTVHVLDGLMDL